MQYSRNTLLRELLCSSWVFKLIAVATLIFPVLSVAAAFAGDRNSGYMIEFKGKSRSLQTLSGDEFKSYVAALKEKHGGDRAAFVEDLRSTGFTCSLSPSSLDFDCVRFGCERAFPFFRYLVQWNVGNSRFGSGDEYSVMTMAWQFVKGCFRPQDVMKEQQKYIADQELKKPVLALPSRLRSQTP